MFICERKLIYDIILVLKGILMPEVFLRLDFIWCL